MKLIAVGDIHLGRRPSRLPGELGGRARELGPAGAWERVVEAAVREQVHAVALAGDVVEHEDDFFEAYRELHRGVSQLAAAGIQVLGVVGNHDVQVLPRLADQIPDFRLLGRDGRWESARIEAGDECLTLWGRSFPRSRTRENPLAEKEFERQPGPNLGLLHCDRDQPGSVYAPVSRLDLDAAGLDGWLLGHIHKPDALTASSFSGYLGSITGADPGEPGRHGPWLVTIEGGRVREVEQWLLAQLRWEYLEIDLTGIARPENARVRLLDALKELDAELAASPWLPEAVGLRVTLTGRSRFGEAALALFSQEDREHIYSGAGGTHYFVEQMDVATRPEIPLEELAARSDPPGLLARRLLLLDQPSENPERQALLAEARRRLETQSREARWSGLHPQAPDEEAAAEWLRRSGTRLLEKMLAQLEAEA